MFVSFFPRPRLFFWSLLAWAVLVMAVWYGAGDSLGTALGILDPAAPAADKAKVSVFLSGPFLWFYVYFLVVTLAFFAFWRIVSPHAWAMWSILGSAFIIFATYFFVQVQVAVNAWYGPFYDLIQAALSKSRPVNMDEYVSGLLDFAGIAAVAVAARVVTRFFVNHFIFRWRIAMNGYYMENWPRLRHIEGAAQRVQEDTMRFAQIMENLGASFIDAIMTLIAFLPILMALSANVSELPVVGAVPYPLVVAALLWAILGTGFLALVGIKLPGLEFLNQRVEAAYRKELVYGEDDASRAKPEAAGPLFAGVIRAYFRYYAHYLYFNVARFGYSLTDNVFPFIVLAPTIVLGKITLGAMTQILNAFGQVRESFQYLVNSWTTIVEFLSIYKRLRAFEATLAGEKLSPIEQASESAAA